MFAPNKRFWAALFLMSVCIFHFSLKEAAAQDEITLTVTFVGGGSSLDFGHLKNLDNEGGTTTESSTRQIRLLMEPAAGNTKPYVVTQIVDSAPANETGTPTASNSIVYRVEEENGSGTIHVPQETPFVSGEQEIYHSSPQGGNAQLLITYDLVASPEQEAGSYAGSVTFRVSTL